MGCRIGRDVPSEFKREFVPDDADPGDPEQVEKLYHELYERNTATRDDIEDWLHDWSELESAVQQEEAIRFIRMTCKTDDPEREAEFLHFVENVSPRIKPLRHMLMEKFLASPAADELDRDRYGVLIRDLKNRVEIFREENVPLQTQEEKLSQKYQKITGAMTVMHEGKEQTLPQMAKYLELRERDARKEAWEKVAARRLADKEALEDIFDRMIELRQEIGGNAGFENFRDYAFKSRGRFDYGPAECMKFHEAVEKVAVPLYRELQERRKRLMGLDTLRPWDLRADPLGRPPLEPFHEVKELAAGCREIFDRLDPELGRRFGFMAEHDLLDLSSRKGKAPGAYSHGLEEARQPFIFQNAAGLDSDVSTLLHEAGHSFHALECRDEPLVFYRHAPLEFAEVASMSMEFLGGDHLDVFYSEEEKKRSVTEHLESVVMLFCWTAAVDAFQHWVYTHPGHGRKERAKAWTELRRRFGGVEDWSGYEEEERFSWHRQLHIFEIPFYYIEYGIAQMGALQIWLRARKDRKRALSDYRKALALGGSKPLPELFAAAGATFDMGIKTLKPMLDEVRKELGV